MAKKKRGPRRGWADIGTWPTPEKPQLKGGAAAAKKKKTKKKKTTKKTKKKKKTSKKRASRAPQKR